MVDYATVALPIGTSGKQSKWTLIVSKGNFVTYHRIDHELSAPTEDELDRVLPKATLLLGRKARWLKTNYNGRWVATTEGEMT